MERLHLAPFHHLQGLHKHARKQDSATTLLREEKHSHWSLEMRRAECPELNGRKILSHLPVKI